MSKVTRLHPESKARPSSDSSAVAPPLDRDATVGAAQGDIPSFLRSITASNALDANDHDPLEAPEDAPDSLGADDAVAADTTLSAPDNADPVGAESPPFADGDLATDPNLQNEPASALLSDAIVAMPDSAGAASRELDEFARELREFDPRGLISSDARALRNAQARWEELVHRAVQLSMIADGVPELAGKHLPSRLATDIRSAVSTAGAIRERARNQMVEQMVGRGAEARTAHAGGGEGGAIASAIDAVVRSPLTLLSAGGAMLMAGFQAAGDAMDRRRQSAFEILGGQVKSVAADIEADAQWLRSHGLEQVVNEMKASGIAPSDAAGEMQRGGKLERLGLEVKGLMAEPDVVERMDRLSANMQQFVTKSERYAKAGVAADRDPNDLLAPAMERVESALDGLPAVDADGNVGLLSKKFEELAERVRELVERMISKLIPGR